MAFVTSVVHEPGSSTTPPATEGARPFSTACRRARRVDGTLHDHIAPDGSRATRSVKVPPTSTPIRTPGVTVTGTLSRSRWRTRRFRQARWRRSKRPASARATVRQHDRHRVSQAALPEKARVLGQFAGPDSFSVVGKPSTYTHVASGCRLLRPRLGSQRAPVPRRANCESLDIGLVRVNPTMCISLATPHPAIALTRSLHLALSQPRRSRVSVISFADHIVCCLSRCLLGLRWP